MLGCRSRDTSPELALRSAVHRLGLRYRVLARPLPELRRTADMVFTRARVAVFLDGCFWHGCVDHFSPPLTNREYWSAKIDGNRRRDWDTDERLAAAGWLAVRVWEHQDPQKAATELAHVIRRRLHHSILNGPSAQASTP
jgi:DNA mismatch endonuclease (patch repair protein)